MSDQLRLTLVDEDGNKWHKYISRDSIKSINPCDGYMKVVYYGLPVAKKEEHTVKCNGIDDFALNNLMK